MRAGITFAFCLFTFALAAAGCGSGDNVAVNAGPQVASLEGDRNDGPIFEDAVDVKSAPSEAHGLLAKLLPKSALRKGSVEYGNWNAETAGYSTKDPGNAALPMIAADYRSTGFTIVTDTESETGSADQEYVQACKLIVIRAPEAIAAQPIADKIVAALKAKEFSPLDDMQFALGVEKTENITRMGLIVGQGETDDVYIAYVKVVGDLVIYALESEAAPAQPGPGDTQLSSLNEGGRGTRVGAQLISLVLMRLQSQ